MKSRKRAAAIGAAIALIAALAVPSAASAIALSEPIATNQTVEYATYRYHVAGPASLQINSMPTCGGGAIDGALRISTTGVRVTPYLSWSQLASNPLGVRKSFRTTNTNSTTIPTGYYALTILTHGAAGGCNGTYSWSGDLAI